ncbi:hypothetical protein AMECASPLE_007575 [Ameca splendens]|uniref:Uncharacterized protein n=1 Tax=Ameca splendens TaxID=208324 RepID=A0ABV0Z8H8_9TELE
MLVYLEPFYSLECTYSLMSLLCTLSALLRVCFKFSPFVLFLSLIFHSTSIMSTLFSEFPTPVFASPSPLSPSIWYNKGSAVCCLAGRVLSEGRRHFQSLCSRAC